MQKGKAICKNSKIYVGGKVYKGGAILLFIIVGYLTKGLLGI